MSDTEDINYERRPEFNEGSERENVEPEQKPVDHHGLQTPGELEPQEEVVYVVNDEPAFNVTRALFIGNLRRPINAIDFQNYLKDLAAACGDNIIERAWLNRTRTHGIVLVDKEEGAKYIRERLNGTKYPSEEEDARLKDEHDVREKENYEKQLQEYEEGEDKDSLPEPALPKEYSVERKLLYVDFIPVKAINQWIYEEDKGPRNGKWKIGYENKGDDILATHALLSGDFMPRYNQRHHHPKFGRGRGGGYRGGYGGPVYNRRGLGGYGYNGSGPKPYGVYPPRNGYDGQPRRGGYRGRRGGYYPNNGERSSYVPGDSNREERGRYSRTDSYQPRSEYRERSWEGSARTRSRSPL